MASGEAPGALEDDMEWIAGGFYLVRPADRPPEARGDLLPERLLTVSACVADPLPAEWALSWVELEPDELAPVRELLGLDDEGMAELQEEVDELFDAGRFGWPDVFYELRAAREFAARWLSRLDGLRLIGIALPDAHVEAFLDDAEPASEDEGPAGVWEVVERGQPPPAGGRTLGFDVLGLDEASFHSFACNGLEVDFAERLKLRPNADGLYDTLEEAERAAALVRTGELGAEPVLWLPWRIDEYPLADAG